MLTAPLIGGRIGDPAEWRSVWAAAGLSQLRSLV